MRKHFINIRSKNLALEAEIPTSPFVFLGGTVDSVWRDVLVDKLTISYFDPIVTEEWTEEHAKFEEIAKENAHAILYVITPKQHGNYSLVECAVSACKAINKKIIIVFLNSDDGEQFDDNQIKSNDAVIDLLSKNTNAEFFKTLKDTAEALNSYLSNIVIK